MSKLLKLLGKVATISIEWFLVFFICFAFLVRTSPVQTFLAQRATNYFSKELKTRVNIKKVSIVFFNRIVLDGVDIEDRKGDKIAYMKSLFVTFKGINQLKHEIRLKQVKVENGVFHLNQDAHSGKFNFDFIIDYFGSTKNQNTPSYVIKIDQLALQGLDLKYDDYRIAQKTNEIDYDHIHLKQLYLFANDFSINRGTIKAAINHLSLYEKCGLQIKRFAGYVKVNDTGIRVKELRTKINRSEAYLPKFQMLYSKWDDFLSFDDKVQFDAIVDSSNVNMKDIRFFASELEGMDQICKVKAVVTQPLKNMTIDNLHLEFGKNSVIEGKIILPDFRNLKMLDYDQQLTYARISTEDIEQFKFPKITEIQPIDLNEYIEKFNFFECTNLKITGTNQNSDVFAKKIKTKIGTFNLVGGLNIKHNVKIDNYSFQSIRSSRQKIKIDSFDLGKMFDFEGVGNLSGNVDLKGEFDFKGDFSFEDINGEINQIALNNYHYKSITLDQFSFKEDEIISKFKSSDPNAEFDFDGIISLKNNYKFDFKSNIKRFDLNTTHFSTKPQSIFAGNFKVDFSGLTLNNVEGLSVPTPK